MSSGVLWKIELKSIENGFLAEKISKQSIEGAVCFSWLLIVKCSEGLFKKEIVKLNGIRTWRFEKFSAIYIAKNEEACSEANIKGMAQLCPTLCDHTDCSLPDSSVYGIFYQESTPLEWGAISFSRGTSQLRDQTQVSCIAGIARLSFNKECIELYELKYSPFSWRG